MAQIEDLTEFVVELDETSGEANGAAYLVQAKTQDCHSVMMMIDPPTGSPQASGAMSGSQTGGSSGSTFCFTLPLVPAPASG